MFFTLFSKIIRPASIWVVLVTSLSWGSYQVTRPTQPTMTPSQEKALMTLENEVALWLGQGPMPSGELVVATLSHDPFGRVTDRVRQAVARTARFALRDYSISDKITRLAQWNRKPVESRQAAVQSAHDQKVHAVLWGQIKNFSDIDDQASLDLDLELLSALDGSVQNRQQFQIRTSAGLLGSAGQALLPGQTAGIKGFFWRLLGWLVAAMLLPVVTYPLAARLVTSDSNAVVFAALSGYVLVSSGLGFLFLLPYVNGVLGGLLMSFLLAMSFYYDWRILDKIKELRHG